MQYIHKEKHFRHEVTFKKQCVKSKWCKHLVKYLMNSNQYLVLIEFHLMFGKFRWIENENHFCQYFVKCKIINLHYELRFHVVAANDVQMFQPVLDWLMIETLVTVYEPLLPIHSPFLLIALTTIHPQTGSYALKCALFLLHSRHEVLWVKVNFRDRYLISLSFIQRPT